MAQPKRNDAEATPAFPATARPAPLAQPDHGYAAGGQIGQMQADLAQRLAQGYAAPAIAVSPDERAVRFLSVAGGYVALAAAYAGAAMLILR